MASMATIEKGDVQILVHITAPSRGRDDVRYRALAQAYLDFEPVNHHIPWQRRQSEETGEEGAGTNEDDWVDTQTDAPSFQLQHELQHSTQEERESEASYRPEDEPEPETASTAEISTQDRNLILAGDLRLAYSPPMSFQSVEGNLNSPPIENRGTVGGELLVRSSPISQNSWQQLPSSGADSQPEPASANQLLSSPSPVRETLGHLTVAPAADPVFQEHTQIDEIFSSLVPFSCRESHLTQPEFFDALGHVPSISSSKEIGNARYSLRSRSSNIISLGGTRPLKRKEAPDAYTDISPSIASELGATISFTSSENLGKSSKKMCLEKSQREQSQVGVSPLPDTQAEQSRIEQSLIEGSRVVNSQAEEPDVDEPCLEKSQVIKGQSTAATAISSSKVTEVATPSPSNLTSIWADVLEVRPPPPRSSKKELVPEKLITPSLLQLVEKFPVESLYQVEKQVREPRPMERGYWLVNSQAWDERLKRSFWNYVAVFVSKGHGGWGLWSVRDEESKFIRVYCWGITVKHVYLFLHISSRNKIKGTGARWIDGKGEEIIIMP